MPTLFKRWNEAVVTRQSPT